MYATVGDNTGYFVEFKGAYFPIEFDFTHCFLFLVKYNKQKSCWEFNKLPTEEYHPDIPDSEVTDWSEWGPIDKESSDNSDTEDTKSEGQPENIDIKIPTQDEERSKRQWEKLAESIPILTWPRSNTATSRLPPITTVMATQTMTEPIQAITTEGEQSSPKRVEDLQEKTLTQYGLADQEIASACPVEVEVAVEVVVEETVEEEEMAAEEITEEEETSKTKVSATR